MIAAPLTIEAALFCRLLRRTRTHRLSLGQIQILSLIISRDGESVSMGDASRHIGVTEASFTQIVDCLERARLVRRRPSATDRRKTWVEITETGRATITDILSA